MTVSSAMGFLNTEPVVKVEHKEEPMLSPEGPIHPPTLDIPAEDQVMKWLDESKPQETEFCDSDSSHEGSVWQRVPTPKVENQVIIKRSSSPMFKRAPEKRCYR